LHKRLTIVATTYPPIAAVGRMPFLGETWGTINGWLVPRVAS